MSVRSLSSRPRSLDARRPARSLLVITALFAVAALTGCGDSSDAGDGDAKTTEPLPATFANVQSLFTRSCAFSTCHSGDEAPGGFSLDAGKAYDSIVDKDSTVAGTKLVAPGDAEHSLLYQVLLGPVGKDIEQMPQAMDPLSAAEIDLIKRWINDGAKQDLSAIKRARRYLAAALRARILITKQPPRASTPLLASRKREAPTLIVAPDSATLLAPMAAPCP